MRRYIAHGLAVFLCVASLGAGAARGPNNSESGSTVPKQTIPAKAAVKQKASKPKPYQVGIASWYGSYFDGKPTASGEPFDMHDMTAAHLTLPLGTYVKVTNLRNQRAVIVRVNDRGPVVEGRIIDLSYSAAKALDFKARGLQRVRLDIVEPETVAVMRPVADLP
jgi:rare lipoprotein A